MAVEPHQVTALMLKAGQPEIEIIIPVAKPEDATGTWDGIGNAIRDALAQLGSRAGQPTNRLGKLSVEVADTLVHYDVLMVDARRLGLGQAELEHLAAVGLADTLALDPGSLVMRCSVQPDGLSAVVCAMPAALVNVVKQASDDTGCRLKRLEPAFVAFWNRYCKHGKSHDALLARLRGSALMLGWVRDGKWQALAAERLAKHDWAALRESCDAFCRRIGVPDHGELPIFLDADLGDIPADASSRWQQLTPRFAVASDLISDSA
jgi:hypothetical protein